MRYIALLLAAGFALSIGLAKSPAESSSTVCDRYRSADLIFTGSAENAWITMVDTRKSPVHRRKEKSKRVRFLAREWYKGQRSNTVEIWMTPADCPLTMVANQTYLIYAHKNTESGRIESNGCMGTVAVENAPVDLTYLAAAVRGPGLGTRLTGNAGGADINIQMKSGINTRYAITDGKGLFTFDGLNPGDWELSTVGGSAAKTVHLAPDSCVVEDLSR